MYTSSETESAGEKERDRERGGGGEGDKTERVNPAPYTSQAHLQLAAQKWGVKVPASFRRRWTNLIYVIRTSTWKPRPESILDCLICAEFARHRQ